MQATCLMLSGTSSHQLTHIHVLRYWKYEDPFKWRAEIIPVCTGTEGEFYTWSQFGEDFIQLLVFNAWDH